MRRLLIAALVAAVLVPAPGPALAQGNIVDLLDGIILVGERGTTDDLELTQLELAAATRRVEDLRAGIVMPDPATAGDAAEHNEVIAEAASQRLGSAGMVVERCLVDAQRTAAACIEQLFLADALAILVIGDLGDLVAASEVAARNKVILVATGDSTLSDPYVRLTMNPVTAATQQGVVAGRSLGVVPIRRNGNALMLAGRDPEEPDAVREATEAGIRRTAPRMRIVDRIGPIEVRTVEELETLLAEQPRMKLVTGEGLLLDQVDGVSLERLPRNLRLIAWECSRPVIELLDLAARLRGCVARADDAAGEAAANVVLAIKTSRDVAGLIEIPVYIDRGRVEVGPATVELGRRFTRASPTPTDVEVAGATTALSGRTVGVIVPVEPGPRESEAQQLIRTGVEAAIRAGGADVQVCVGRGAAAVTCMDDLVTFGAIAIMPIATGTDLIRPSNAAVRAGVMVIGVNETRLGDAGAVYVVVNPRSVGRLAGRMAGAYADRVWKNEPVEVVLFNDAGAARQDSIASAVERALVQTDPQVQVAARLASRGTPRATAAVRTLLRRYPATRMIVGRNAASAAPILIRRKNVNPDLVIFAQECTPDIVDAIDAGVGTGGRIKGCVDRNPTGAGLLAGEVLTRMAAGATIPEIVEVPVIAYQPGDR